MEYREGRAGGESGFLLTRLIQLDVAQLGQSAAFGTLKSGVRISPSRLCGRSLIGKTAGSNPARCGFESFRPRL